MASLVEWRGTVRGSQPTESSFRSMSTTKGMPIVSESVQATISLVDASLASRFGR